MHLRPRRKLAAQLKTVCRPVAMLVFYHTWVTKRPNYLMVRLLNCKRMNKGDSRAFGSCPGSGKQGV